MFVHRGHGSLREWEDPLSRIGRFGLAVALEMPGFGNADEPEAYEDTVEGYAKRLGGVLAELGIRRAHLVLHDSGGPWGLQRACEYPEAPASAMLINISAICGYLWHHAGRTLRLLRRPALVLWGARDPYLPVRYAERQREFFRDARIVVLEERRAPPVCQRSRGRCRRGGAVPETQPCHTAATREGKEDLLDGPRDEEAGHKIKETT